MVFGTRFPENSGDIGGNLRSIGTAGEKRVDCACGKTLEESNEVNTAVIRHRRRIATRAGHPISQIKPWGDDS